MHNSDRLIGSLIIWIHYYMVHKISKCPNTYELLNLCIAISILCTSYTYINILGTHFYYLCNEKIQKSNFKLSKLEYPHNLRSIKILYTINLVTIVTINSLDPSMNRDKKFLSLYFQYFRLCSYLYICICAFALCTHEAKRSKCKCGGFNI